MCDKIIERIVDTHHTYVFGHAQTAIAQRGDGTICHLVVCRIDRRHGSVVLGQIPAGLVAAVGRPVALERLHRLDMPALERVLPTGATELLVHREGWTADISNLLVAKLKQMVHKQQRAAVMVGIDRGHARMRIHGDDNRADSWQRIERLKVGRHAAHADDDAIDRQRRHAAGGLGKRKLLGLGHLDQRDGAAMLASGTGDTIDHRQVPKLGDIVDA